VLYQQKLNKQIGVLMIKFTQKKEGRSEDILVLDRIFHISFLLILIYLSACSFPQEELRARKSYIITNKGEGVLSLSETGKSTPLYASSMDYPGVLRVLSHLQNDIFKVTDSEPEIIMDLNPKSGDIVLVGTLGKNTLIDDLVQKNKLNVDELKGKWETFLIQVVANPFPGVDNALVIIGSDKRGTIYGMYDLAEKIGVSPWYWWADVPVKKKSSIYVLPGRYTMGEPKVKYRGIFINDEAPALSGWSIAKFGTEAFNHKLYEHVFELILRLKGNFLWPAMWGRAFYDDDSINPKLADEYGVVIGTSHHEPMMRAHVEWSRYGSGPWNYEKNSEKLSEFWRKGIERMGNYESLVTLAMRGDGDEAMSEEANIEVLEKIVNDQREIIKDVTGKNIDSVTMVWALYKEVQEYYDKGMRVPDDVTILLCDDNWGNLRKLPKLNEKTRKGGYGIYYHYDYVGGPRNYKWLNTNQIERVWEQMHLAYEYGARQIWVVNVGDIKPLEFPIDFLLDYAWNPEAFPASNLPHYYKDWSEEQFGTEYSEEIAEILSKYTKFNSRRKPELLSPETYSLTNYREAETIVDDYNKLTEESAKLNNSIPKEYRDAYFQLVHHPVAACANLNELYVTAAKNHQYQKQGRSATNLMAEKVKELFKKDAEITDYYNNILSDGKWKHMMDQTHIGYTYWQQPDFNTIPEVKEINIPDKPGLGVAIEESENWFPKDTSNLKLPEFDKFNQQSYFIEIFNRGKIPFEYTVNVREPWVLINKSNGEVQNRERLWVRVNWNKVPTGKHSITLTIKGSEGSKVNIYAEVNNPASPKREEIDGFVESNGYVSIEAEHFTNSINTNSITWEIIPNLGRTLSGIAPFPVTAPSQTAGGDSPRLEYKVSFFTAGEVKVNTYFSPTLNFHNKPEGIRYAISFDDAPPQIINMTYNPNYPDLNRDGIWNKWVADNINISISKHLIDNPGEHVLKFWMVDPGIVLQKLVIDLGGLKPSYLGPPESFRQTKKTIKDDH
jgi:hypothetical protein